MKMFRVHFALWVVLLIVGYLIGFVPQYQKNRELQAQFQDPQKTIVALQAQAQLGELRDIASLMLLEMTRQNYGLARDYSEQYYSKLKNEVDSVQDPELKKSLGELVTTRDSLASSLAAANPSALSAAQIVVSKTFEVARKP